MSPSGSDRRVQSAAAYFPAPSDYRSYTGQEYLSQAHYYLAQSNFVLAYNNANCAHALLSGEKERWQVKQIFARCGENMLNDAESLIQQKDFDAAVARVNTAAALITPQEQLRSQELHIRCGRGYLQEGLIQLKAGALEKAVSHFSAASSLLSNQEQAHAQACLLRCGHLFLEQAEAELVNPEATHVLYKLEVAWSLLKAPEKQAKIKALFKRFDPYNLSFSEKVKYEWLKEEIERTHITTPEEIFHLHFAAGKSLLETDFSAGLQRLLYAQSLNPYNLQLNELLVDLEGERPL